MKSKTCIFVVLALAVMPVAVFGQGVQPVDEESGQPLLPPGVMADEEIIQAFSWGDEFGGVSVEDLIEAGQLSVGMVLDTGDPAIQDQPWAEVAEELQRASDVNVSIEDIDGIGSCLVIDKPGEQGELVMSLLQVTSPAVTSERYALVGLVKYEVAGQAGTLEMLNHFPGGDTYFSRTAGAGPLAPLAGTSDWRVFRLPFTNQPGGRPPVALDFNLLFPGRGCVILGPTYLVQTRIEVVGAASEPSPSDPAASTTDNKPTSPSPWRGVLLKNPWPLNRKAWIGLGSLAALWLLTSIANWLIKRGKARRFVLIWLWGLVVMCGVFIVNFAVMMITDRSYLISTIAIGVVLLFGVHFVNTLRRVSARYADFELRKMSAKDAS
jgi:hypothetical protein